MRTLSRKQKEALQTLWIRGNLRCYLRESQREVKRFIELLQDPFVEASRQWGKTTGILNHVLGKLNQNEGWVARWCEPWKNQAREIVMPEIEKVQDFFALPDSMRYRFVSQDSYYVAPWGSKLFIRGVNEDKGRSARGPFAHIVVADEFGFWSDPTIVETIFQPQLLTTRGQLIIASTPPEDLGHEYYSRKQQAIREKRFIQKTIHQNESLTEEDIQKICARAGGSDSPTWKREYLCEPIASPERLVIPEFREALHVIADDSKPPPHFDSYVGIDLGFEDRTAFLFAHWDFLRRKLVIEDEHFARGKNSKELTDPAKEIEKRLWGEQKPHKRTGDNDKQQLYDMLTMCDYSVMPSRKDDKMAALNALRLRFTNNQIEIKERCKNLIFQLKVGLWNESRTTYLRGESTGHLDGIDALVYLNRSINEHKNPYPLYPGVTTMTHFVDPRDLRGKTANDLLSIFRPLTQGRKRPGG